MKLISLEAQNIKRLKAVEIAFRDGLMVIGGKNGAGKSSCLDAIAMALGGKDLICDQPLRKGEARGHVTVTLGGPETMYTVTRKFSSKGTTSLVIEAADGSRPTSPQALLDGLLGSLAFDPLAFSRMSVKTQAETLRELVGLDTAAVDGEIGAAFAKRTEVGRDVSRLEGSVQSAPHHDGVPAAEVSATAIADELTAAMELAGKKTALMARSEREADAAQKARDAITEKRAAIEKLEAEIATLQEAQIEGAAAADSFKLQAEQIVAPDLEEIRGRMKAADQTNAKVRQNAQRKALQSELLAARRTHEALQEELVDLRDKRLKMIEGCKFPVAGLAIDENGVLLEGLPFSQASQAEQLRVSVAMGLAMNPKLKLLLIRDGSLLDETNLAAIAEMAENAGAQILMERVSVDAFTSVVIEDGAVQAADEVGAPA